MSRHFAKYADMEWSVAWPPSTHFRLSESLVTRRQAPYARPAELFSLPAGTIIPYPLLQACSGCVLACVFNV